MFTIKVKKQAITNSRSSVSSSKAVRAAEVKFSRKATEEADEEYGLTARQAARELLALNEQHLEDVQLSTHEKHTGEVLWIFNIDIQDRDTRVVIKETPTWFVISFHPDSN